MTKPKVSVLLPVYNNKDDILNAIESVINQIYTNWELIIIDDYSTENVYDLLNIKYNNNNKIKLIRNKKNVGTYCSLNNGLLISNGKYICRIDSDDTIDPNFINDQVIFLENNKQFIATKNKAIRDNGNKCSGEVTLFYRTDIIYEIGFYDSVRFGGDGEFYDRVKQYYGTIKEFDKVVYYAKSRCNSLTTSKLTGLKGGKHIRYDYIYKYQKWHHNNKNIYMDYPLSKRPFKVNRLMLP
jgi:glycosyltransferase involved in cell wall biosynthesis